MGCGSQTTDPDLEHMHAVLALSLKTASVICLDHYCCQHKMLLNIEGVNQCLPWFRKIAGKNVLSLQVASALVKVAEGAIRARLHVESCHPCLRLALPEDSVGDRLCTMPAVVVDSCMAMVGPDGIIRVPAEFSES